MSSKVFPIKCSDEKYPTKDRKLSSISDYNDDSSNSSDSSISEENYFQRYDKILNSAFRRNYVEESTSSLCSSPSSSLFGNTIKDEIFNENIENLDNCSQQQTLGESRIKDNLSLISSSNNNTVNIGAEEILSDIGFYRATNKIPERFLRNCYTSQNAKVQRNGLKRFSFDSTIRQDSTESVIENNDDSKQLGSIENCHEDSIEENKTDSFSNDISINEPLDQLSVQEKCSQADIFNNQKQSLKIVWIEQSSEFEESCPIDQKTVEDRGIFYKQKSIHEEIEEAQRCFMKFDDSYRQETVEQRSCFTTPTYPENDDCNITETCDNEINTQSEYRETCELNAEEINVCDMKTEVYHMNTEEIKSCDKYWGELESYDVEHQRAEICDINQNTSSQTFNQKGRINTEFSQIPNVAPTKNKMRLGSIEKKSMESFELEDIFCPGSNPIESVVSKSPSDEVPWKNVLYQKRPRLLLSSQKLNSSSSFSSSLASPLTINNVPIDRDRIYKTRDTERKLRNNNIYSNKNTQVQSMKTSERKRTIPSERKISEKTRQRNPLLFHCVSPNFKCVIEELSTESNQQLPISLVPHWTNNLTDAASVSNKVSDNDSYNSYHFSYLPKFERNVSEINKSSCGSVCTYVGTPYLTCGMDDITVYSSDSNFKEMAQNSQICSLSVNDNNNNEVDNTTRYSTSITIFIKNPSNNSNHSKIGSDSQCRNYSGNKCLNEQTNSLEAHDYCCCDSSSSFSSAEGRSASNIRNISNFENVDQNRCNEEINCSNSTKTRSNYDKYENTKTSFRSEVFIFLNANKQDENQKEEHTRITKESYETNSVDSYNFICERNHLLHDKLTNETAQCNQSILSLHKTTQTDITLASASGNKLYTDQINICIRCLCNIC